MKKIARMLIIVASISLMSACCNTTGLCGGSYDYNAYSSCGCSSCWY